MNKSKNEIVKNVSDIKCLFACVCMFVCLCLFVCLSKMFVFILEKLFESIERYTDVSNIETVKDLSNSFERNHLFQKVSNSMLVSFLHVHVFSIRNSIYSL